MDEESARLRKAAQDFEAVFLHHMLREMRRTAPDSGLLGGGATEGLYRDMLDQALAERLAERGGLGLGEMLYQQLSKEASAAIPPEKDS
ncbi:MAG: rod-binding protein [Armatimonadetes bacterium]|nr:rod-binding protein [Armatimonadota bacterium]